jgi:hypothetical protein
MRHLTATLTLLILISTALAAGNAHHARAQSPAGSVRLVAVDADAAGNSPNALGSLNVCAEVPVGQSRDIDVIVQGVPALTDDAGGLAGYEFRLYYNPSFMRITGVNITQQMLSANPDSAVIDGLGDSVPNDSGRFLVVAADFGSDRGESGDGVLARITVEGVAIGTTNLTISPPGDFQAVEVTRLNDSGNHEYTIDGTQNALLAVGESCNPAATPPPPATPVTTQTPSPPTGEPGATDGPAASGDAGSTESPGAETPDGEDGSASPTGSPGEGGDDENNGSADNGDDDDGSDALLFVLLGLGVAAIAAGIAFFVINRRRAGGESAAGGDLPPAGDEPPSPSGETGDATPPDEPAGPPPQ